MWIYMFKELIHTVNVETEHNTSFHQKYTTSLKCMPLPIHSVPLLATPAYEPLNCQVSSCQQQLTYYAGQEVEAANHIGCGGYSGHCCYAMQR